MEFFADGPVLSASDLVGHLNCRYLTSLNLLAAVGSVAKPEHYDLALATLHHRGQRHEQAFIDHLIENGHSIKRIDGIDASKDAVAATHAAMATGEEIIVQGMLGNGRWRGRADILRRVETPSDLGPFSYEIIDAKLARETKGGTILQLCLYGDLLGDMQGVPPENLYVVVPWSDFEPQRFRFADFGAYFRRVKMAVERAVMEEAQAVSYPDPQAFCEVCRWQIQCDARRRKDDHLCLVAGISKSQIAELRSQGYVTMQALGEMPLPLPFKPRRGSSQSLENIREQAAMQIKGRSCGENVIALLEIVPEFGLAALPEPSEGDVFFDIESNSFVGEHGLEYLFGYVYADANGNPKYTGDWAFDRENEKLIFERFVDFVTSRQEKFPDMHVYHFSSYDPGALKRLMGRYATRENEVDNLLRLTVFVDLLRITRTALRASVESYSLKKLEPFFNFKRTTPLQDARGALTRVSTGLELNDIPSIDDGAKKTVGSYNRDDCLATAALRDWLEDIRDDMGKQGMKVPRPEPKSLPDAGAVDPAPRMQALIRCLTKGVPVDPRERSCTQQATWILAYILDWHRRENKAAWWEFFRLKGLNEEELLEERSAISRLEYLETVDWTTTGIPTDRYRFEAQEVDMRGDEEIYGVGGAKVGKAVGIALDKRTIDIRKVRNATGFHPNAVYAHKYFDPKEQAASLFRLGEYVARYGIEEDGDYRAACDLLMRAPMDTNSQAFQCKDEQPLDAALRLAKILDKGVLPIQGPPGTGKSYTGAHIICELVKRGKTVGITANSHKVIRNLIDKAIKVAPELGVDLVCVQKPEFENNEAATRRLFFAETNQELINAVGCRDAEVAGATSFFWARKEAKSLVDVLVVDEAGQMSLANVLAVSQAAPALILLGDPQQLEQPTQGSHPDGTGVSALEHLLEGRQTIRKNEGLFLGTTYRMQPEICAFTSELFYDGKLKRAAGCEEQTIKSDGEIAGAGLRYLPVEHQGNVVSSIEEAEAVKFIHDCFLSSNARWTDRGGISRSVTEDDLLIIAPYNAQVFEIKKQLPNARVGTVDKFQGQEAPIAIYSMASSSYADAPRGLEFLYSANRFNVAISRAKCLAILVASPQVFEADCRTPEQMKLINAFCRYLEMSSQIQLVRHF